MLKEIMDKFRGGYLEEKSQVQKNLKKHKQEKINEVVDGLRIIGYRKDRTTQFYVLRLDIDEFKTKLIMGKTKVSIFECNYCQNGNVVINEVGIPKYELQGNQEQSVYQNKGHLIGTSKFTKILKAYDIVGYQEKEVNIVSYDLKKVHIDDLTEIEIKGRVDLIHDSRGERIKSCLICDGLSEKEKKRTRDGIVIRHEDWDGSDIFKFNGMEYIFVTDKFKEMIEREEIKGIILKSVIEYNFIQR